MDAKKRRRLNEESEREKVDATTKDLIWWQRIYVGDSGGVFHVYECGKDNPGRRRRDPAAPPPPPRRNRINTVFFFYYSAASSSHIIRCSLLPNLARPTVSRAWRSTVHPPLH